MAKVTEYQIIPISEASLHIDGPECWCKPERESQHPPTWQHFTKSEACAKALSEIAEADADLL